MPAAADSLILREQEQIETSQPFLFATGSLPTIDQRQPKYHCTAEYLFKSRPDVYRAAVDMLVEPGMSIRQICRTLHISHNTLASIQEREAPILDTRKKVILKSISRGLRLSAERVEELAPEMTARDAIIAVGVLTEKMQLLGGEATTRIEVTPGGNIYERFARFHEEIIKSVQGRVIEATEIGLDGENVEQKAIGQASASPDEKTLQS